MNELSLTYADFCQGKVARMMGRCFALLLHSVVVDADTHHGLSVDRAVSGVYRVATLRYAYL